MSKRRALASELQLKYAKEVISLSQECQQLSANLERVFMDLVKPSNWEDHEDGYRSAALMNSVRADCIENLLVMRTVLKNTAKAIAGKI